MDFFNILRGGHENSQPSSGTSTPVYRESSASYPPLCNMQQSGGSGTLQSHLQALQQQVPQQPSLLQATQQQLRSAGLGNGPTLSPQTLSMAHLPAVGSTLAHVLLVSNDRAIATIFHQALSQVPVPSVFHMASAADMWNIIEQIKLVAGRPQGPDIVFYQPEVLVANPGTTSRLKQACSSSCTAVVLQATESIARAVQADEYLPGPTSEHPLRMEDVAMLILKWRSRQASSATSSTASSILSTGAISAQISSPAPATPASNPALTSSVALTSSSSTGLPNGLQTRPGPQPTASSPAAQPTTQAAQLQHLQAQLQVLQLAKQREMLSGGASSSIAAPRAGGLLSNASTEIEPLGSGASSGAGGAVGHSPSHPPPPLRLASAGITPTDALPEGVQKQLASRSTPVTLGRRSGGSLEVQDLVAQVAELRRKLDDKSRAPPSPPTLSPVVSLPVNATVIPVGSVAAAAGFNTRWSGGSGGGEWGSGAVAITGAVSDGSGGGLKPSAFQQVQAVHAADLQHKLLELQQQQQVGMGKGKGLQEASMEQRLQELNQLQQMLTQRSSGSLGGQFVGPPSDRGLLATASAPAGNKMALSLLELPAAASHLQVGMRSREAARGGGGAAAGTSSARRVERHGSMARFVGGSTVSMLPPVQQQQQKQQVAQQQQQLQLQEAQQQLQSGVSQAHTAANVQLLQLQQLQLQLKQHHQRVQPVRAVSGGGWAATDDLQSLASRLSPTNSLTSPLASPTLSGPMHGSLLPTAAGVSGGTVASSESGVVPRSNSFVAAGGPRYRPPRQHSPSPLGGTSPGHVSDGYQSHATSRFATSPLRSGSGGGTGSGGGGTGSGGGGYTSDGGQSPAASPRDSGLSGGMLSIRVSKSGDDAIAAALNAAASDSGDGKTEVNRRAASGSLAAEDEFQEIGGGGSSTDGRSLMDASFALEDSGTGGRGSLSGGPASSIDFLPSPKDSGGRPVSGIAVVTATRGAEAPLLTSRSNQGVTRVGSHRLPPTTLQLEHSAEEDAPLRVGPSRRPDPTSASGSQPVLRPPKPQPPAALKHPHGGAAVVADSVGSADYRQNSSDRDVMEGLSRVDSLGDSGCLPSIDGSKLIAVAMNGKAAGNPEPIAARHAGSTQASALVNGRGEVATAGGTRDGVYRVNVRERMHRDEVSLVASIEGSIAAGVSQQSPPLSRLSGASGSRERAAMQDKRGYTDDIFALLHAADREVGTPAPLQPPRSSTPPARRLARILMSSHPIVITREDFLPP